MREDGRAQPSGCAQVTRPLRSVSRVCDQGKRVVFGAGGGYVEHLATGQRSDFQRQHNVYIMHMHVAEGDDTTELSEGFGRRGSGSSGSS